MSKSALRILLTVLMYSGVLVFLYPYIAGSAVSGVLLLILGAVLTVGSGLCRCFLTEGDCHDHHSTRPAP
jgi:hypothetical protein